MSSPFLEAKREEIRQRHLKTERRAVKAIVSALNRAVSDDETTAHAILSALLNAGLRVARVSR